MSFRAFICAGAAWWGSPAWSNAASLGSGEPLQVSLARIVAALVFSIIVAALAILMIRQRGGKFDLAAWFGRLERRPRPIRVVETRRLSQNADICVVRHGGREYLLLLMAGDARVLSEGEPEADEIREAQPRCD